MSVWNIVKESIETAYYISGILLIIGVYFSFRQLMVMNRQLDTLNEQLQAFKKETHDRFKRAAVEKSLEYLTFYVNVFLPAAEQYKNEFREEVPIPENTDHLFDGKFHLSVNDLSKETLAESIIKQELGLHHLFNRLESFSAAVLHGLVVDELVYTPVARDFCNFVREEHVVLSLLRNGGAPYQNVVELYQKWSDRIEFEKLSLQRKELEDKIKQKGDSYKSTPPIGV